MGETKHNTYNYKPNPYWIENRIKKFFPTFFLIFFAYPIHDSFSINPITKMVRCCVLLFKPLLILPLDWLKSLDAASTERISVGFPVEFVAHHISVLILQNSITTLMLSFSHALDFLIETPKNCLRHFMTRSPRQRVTSTHFRLRPATLRSHSIKTWENPPARIRSGPRLPILMNLCILIISHRFQPFCHTCRDNKVGEP